MSTTPNLGEYLNSVVVPEKKLVDVLWEVTNPKAEERATMHLTNFGLDLVVSFRIDVRIPSDMYQALKAHSRMLGLHKLGTHEKDL